MPPRGEGSSWSRARSILQLWAEVKTAQAASALVGGHRQAGQYPLKRAGGLDGAQGLDGADEGAALAEYAVGEVSSHSDSLERKSEAHQQTPNHLSDFDIHMADESHDLPP
jgi:hypothetical protein